MIKSIISLMFKIIMDKYHLKYNISKLDAY